MPKYFDYLLFAGALLAFGFAVWYFVKKMQKPGNPTPIVPATTTPAAHPTPAPAHAAPAAPAHAAPAVHGHGVHGHPATPSTPSGPWYKRWPFIAALIIAVIVAIASTYITPTGNEGILALLVVGLIVFLVIFVILFLCFWLIALIFKIVWLAVLIVILAILATGWFYWDNFNSKTKVQVTVEVYEYGSKTKTHTVTETVRLGNETTSYQLPAWYKSYTVKVLTVNREVKFYHPTWKKAFTLKGGELGPRAGWPKLPSSASLQLADITK